MEIELREVKYHPRWTTSAIECYQRNCQCRGCMYSCIMENNCMMYATVAKLKAEFGPPLIVDPPLYHNNFERKDFMLLDNQFSGFVLSYKKWPQRLMVYKNRKGINIQNGVIVDNIQRIKERFDKEAIFILYNYTISDMTTPCEKHREVQELMVKYDKNQAAQMLWDAFVKYAITIKASYDFNSGKKTIKVKDPKVPKDKSKGKLYKIILHEFSEIEDNNMCKQANKCAEILFENTTAGQEIWYSEIIDIMNKYPDISEKQTPRRIFDYYKNTLKQKGVLHYD